MTERITQQMYAKLKAERDALGAKAELYEAEVERLWHHIGQLMHEAHNRSEFLQGIVTISRVEDLARPSVIGEMTKLDKGIIERVKKDLGILNE